MAVSEVTKSLQRDGVNRVVLVGDGVPNDDREILPIVAQASAQGVSVTALGLGDDYDETLMGRIAQQSGGTFFYVEDSAKVASFFAEEVTRLHKVVARHAVLELHPGPGVTVTGVVGRAFSGSDHGVVVPLGDLGLGEQAEVVVELSSPSAKNGANVEMLDAVLRYDDGVGGAQHEERAFVGAKSTEDASSLSQGHVKTVEDAFLRAKDAATTLQQIENERNMQNAKSRNMPSPAAAAPPRLPMTPEAQRQAHDKAIHNFQVY